MKRNSLQFLALCFRALIFRKAPEGSAKYQGEFCSGYDGIDVVHFNFKIIILILGLKIDLCIVH